MFDQRDLRNRPASRSSPAICWCSTATASPRPRTPPAWRSTKPASKPSSPPARCDDPQALGARAFSRPSRHTRATSAGRRPDGARAEADAAGDGTGRFLRADRGFRLAPGSSGRRPPVGLFSPDTQSRHLMRRLCSSPPSWRCMPRPLAQTPQLRLTQADPHRSAAGDLESALARQDARKISPALAAPDASRRGPRPLRPRREARQRRRPRRSASARGGRWTRLSEVLADVLRQPRSPRPHRDLARSSTRARRGSADRAELVGARASSPPSTA